MLYENTAIVPIKAEFVDHEVRLTNMEAGNLILRIPAEELDTNPASAEETLETKLVKNTLGAFQVLSGRTIILEFGINIIDVLV